MTDFVAYGDNSTNLAIANLIVYARDVGLKKEEPNKTKIVKLIKQLNQCIRYSYTQTWDWQFEDLLIDDTNRITSVTNCKA